MGNAPNSPNKAIYFRASQFCNMRARVVVDENDLRLGGPILLQGFIHLSQLFTVFDCIKGRLAIQQLPVHHSLHIPENAEHKLLLVQIGLRVTFGFHAWPYPLPLPLKVHR